MFRYFITLLLVISTCFGIRAQSVQVNARFDSTTIVVGDQVKLLIEMERQKDVRVQFPAWMDTLTRNIEIIEVQRLDSVQTANGVMRYTQDIVVTSFDSGRHVLPPIRFPFTVNGHIDTISTLPLHLDVYTVQPDSAQTIADIKSVYRIPIDWFDIYPWILKIGALLAVLALIGFIVYAIVRKRNNKPIFGQPKPAEPPHITALRELDKLRGDKLWQSNRTKDYYTRLSDIVRTYIEGRFGVAAMEMTSDEILKGLRGADFEDNNLVERLRKLFSLADLVKFAKAEPLPDENETSMLDGYLFVNNTKIEVVAEQSDAEKKEDENVVETDKEEKD